jgi:8-oxo-dGTP pyrophosphatase MutT (NUDIX family)
MKTIERDIAGAFIFSSDRCILLGKTRLGGAYQGCWVVPGGGIEPGETELEALQREIFEELSMDITKYKTQVIDMPLTGESEKTLRGQPVNVKMNFINFRVDIPLLASDIKFSAEDDLVEAKWFPLDELSRTKLSPPTHEILQFFGYI